MGDKQNEEEFRVAATEGKSEEVERLLMEGVNVNKQWGTCFLGPPLAGGVGGGNTALHFALQHASEEHVNVVKTLLKHGAGINIKNNKGQTALDVVNEAMEWYKGKTGEKWCEEIISILTLHPVKQRLAFVHGMNDYGLDLDVLKKICEMHLSLHE